MNRATSRETGFTTIELIVTVLVTASFIASISQMISFVGGVALDAHRQEVASNLAYNNMRLYANGSLLPTWFSCIGDEGTETTPPYSDGKAHPSATGQELITSSASVEGLPNPVTQTVRAVAPYGCGSSASGMPIRIVSKVTYGSPTKEVVHATYVTGY